MMTSRLYPVELAVEHVRNRRQRMPVPRMTMGECADRSIDRETFCDQRIIINVHVVIEIDELVPDRLAEHQPGDHDKKKRNKKELAGKNRLLPNVGLAAEFVALTR